MYFGQLKNKKHTVERRILLKFTLFYRLEIFVKLIDILINIFMFTMLYKVLFPYLFKTFIILGITILVEVDEQLFFEFLNFQRIKIDLQFFCRMNFLFL